MGKLGSDSRAYPGESASDFNKRMKALELSASGNTLQVVTQTHVTQIHDNVTEGPEEPPELVRDNKGEWIQKKYLDIE